MVAPVESDLTLSLFIWCVLMLLSKSEPADAFWKLAVPSKSQWWVGVAVELGQHFFALERATCISTTTLALHKFRTPGLCMAEEKYFDFDGESVLWRKSSGQILVSRVKFNLIYMTQRLFHPVFLVSVTTCTFLHVHVQVYKCFLPLTSYVKCTYFLYSLDYREVILMILQVTT